LENSYSLDLPSYPAAIKTMPNLTARSYVIAIRSGLIELSRYALSLSAVICDGCLAQKKAFSPKWRASIPRTAGDYGWMKKIFFIPCLAHRVHNAFVNAIRKNEEIKQLSEAIHAASSALVGHEIEIGGKCPTHVSTRWIYDFDICEFLIIHKENCRLFTRIPDEIEILFSVLQVFKSLTLIFETSKTPLGAAYPVIRKACYALLEMKSKNKYAEVFARSLKHYTLQSVDAPLWHLAYILTRDGHEEIMKSLNHPEDQIQTTGFIKEFKVRNHVFQSDQEV
jgi:hypothetical protein